MNFYSRMSGLAGDVDAAKILIERAKSEEIAEVDILMGIMAPLHWLLGEHWAQGSITVAEEHRVGGRLPNNFDWRQRRKNGAACS